MRTWYVELSSIPTAFLPSLWATIKVVPLPAKGSRTTQGAGLASGQLQVRRHPSCETDGFRCQGAPQPGQQPRSLVAARMHGSTRAGGNVAKWAPRYGAVA